MRKLFCFISIISLLSCSNNDKEFDKFDYSFSGTFSTTFSIKFTNNDTIYLREHWNNESDEKFKHIKSERSYFSILNKKQIIELKELIRNIKFEKLKDEYNQDYTDGSSYAFYIKKNDFEKTLLVHTHDAPKELDSLSNWIYNLKCKLNLREIKKEIEFKSYKFYFIPFCSLPPRSAN